MINRRIILAILLSMSVVACSDPDGSQQIEATADSNPPTLFRLITPDESGITFSNTIEESLNLNVLMYEYLYNGGGVAVGDLNQDGLGDIYFSANVSGNQLYLNQGDLKFKEIAQGSGAAGRSGPWKTGVAFVDINGDNKLDIYLCYSGNLPPEKRKNQLFVNQGNNQNGVPLFKEMAEEYGIASQSPSTSASFFDFDLDGDLDLFLLNHNTKFNQNQDVNLTKALLLRKHEAGSQLFENRQGTFVEVTMEAGISSSSLSYGLGVAVADINEDGYPDIYIGNDYSMPDYLYINQKNGTFKNEILERLNHTSHFSMGNDIADINNDGLLDIFTLDMLPEDNERQKLLLAPDNYELFELNLQKGFHYQYMRNMLQLNAGDGTFQEIGQLAGISNTDWSWSALFADFDNDGWKDLFITNGFLRDYNNQDFLKYMDNYVRTSGGKLKREDLLNMVKNMPSSNLTNYIFQNSSDLTFQNKTISWGVDQPANSSGAAYADLDNDGDLDLIVNNINSPASVYENQSEKNNKVNYLSIKLSEDSKNRHAIGAKVQVFIGDQVQTLIVNPYRGYQSSVTTALHFGLGENTSVDSIDVFWPNGSFSKKYKTPANQVLEISLGEEEKVNRGLSPQAKSLLVEGKSISIPRGKRVNDYKRQPLLINPISENGKAMVLADFNGDQLLDIYVGAGAGASGSLYFQTSSGDFKQSDSQVFQASASSEDSDAVAFDANGDGYLDLYVASGGVYDFDSDDARLRDRLYINDGKGNFSIDTEAIPKEAFVTGTVLWADFNKDGFEDLFVGGRVIPGQFPTHPGARLFINTGKGKFIDKTKDLAPTFSSLGMLTDSGWADLNEDGNEELILVGEAMPVTIYSYQNAHWVDQTSVYFNEPQVGLWNDLTLADWDGDGEIEILAGNLGLNSQIKASSNQPAEILYKDFDNNGSIDAFLGYFIKSTKYPAANRDEILGQVNFLKKRYLDFKSFSNLTMDELFTSEERIGSTSITINNLSTSYFVRDSSGKFQAKALPLELQFSPVYASIAMDVNQDGILDMVLGGNTSYSKLYFGRYDANQGLILIGNGKGDFKVLPKLQSGFSLGGMVRKILFDDNKLFVYQPNEGIKTFKVHPSKTN
jgi:hypothetical protein